MKQGDTVIIKPDYPTKVSHKKGAILAKAGDKVKVIADHNGVMIVETEKKERISIETKYLNYLCQPR